MIQQNLLIINKLGLHARAAAKLVSTAAAFSSQIRVGHSGRMVDCKSIMSVMMLAASKGTELTFEIEGSDAEAALSAIDDLINRRFDEEE
ncbi:HPr family phosphocarrier protein [Thalassolituus sp.]|jgi:phosphotransferase system HPr (HPr) family protein|uniref:HPr family phosphocarrier protein n=2 Tax=Thalassolituus TaxID=187492 RepID=UPI0026261F68|nr:HPr family phosphocarrier protein [uncultured Thalassolituus sp.]TNC92577.1 MAG: phosphocarrier protein HPr [Thalassolituus sp.]